tara:strand:- start:1888 stop:2217 length:330 start_codon:yes stop_codon:yes gene_type:complete
MENSYYIVNKTDRITNNIISKYEFVNIITTRSQQIANDIQNKKNSIIFININDLDSSKIHNSSYVAMEEFKQNKIPYIIKRIIGYNKIELWNLIEDNMYYIDELNISLD